MRKFIVGDECHDQIPCLTCVEIIKAENEAEAIDAYKEDNVCFYGPVVIGEILGDNAYFITSVSLKYALPMYELSRFPFNVDDIIFVTKLNN